MSIIYLIYKYNIFINLYKLSIDKYFNYLYNSFIINKRYIMNKENKKHSWSFESSNELIQRINKYKRIHDIKHNQDVIIHLLDNVLNLKPTTLNLLNKVCNDFKTTKEDILTPIIEKHINKTLKKEGVVKEKHKHTVKAENELLEVLKIIVNEFKNKPVSERKFISPTFVYRYLMINSDKHRQKNYPVIKRVLGGFSDIDISFINEYHKENNLTNNRK